MPRIRSAWVLPTKRAFRTKVTWISSTTSSTSHTGTIRARAVLDNKQGLFTPGLFARVQLLGSGEYDAILIEDRAVGTDQSQSFVLVLGADNKLEYRAVQPGRSSTACGSCAKG